MGRTTSGAVFYGAYDFMKDWALQDEARAMGLDSVDGLELGPQKTLLFGGLAGAMAEASVYPLEVGPL